MRGRVTLGVVLVVTGALMLPSGPGASGARGGASPHRAAAREGPLHLPLAFVPNHGQSDRRVMYQAQAGGASFWFTPTEAVFGFQTRSRGAAVALEFVASSADAEVQGTGRRAGTVNYLIGRDPATWQTGLPAYEGIVYRNMWPGTDLAFRGQSGKLEYEVQLQPWADPSDVRLRYRGADAVSLDQAGNMLLRTPLGVLTDSQPVAYQEIGGRRVIVPSHYALSGTGFGFDLGSYDRRLPLVIDPGLTYSTFLGGAGSDQAKAVAVDAAGNAYVAGLTGSNDFPTTTGAYHASMGGFEDAFVAKLNPAGSALLYSTYLGGSGADEGYGIAVDASGNAYLTGFTGSSDFPTTAGAPSASLGGFEDAFVAKLNPAGSGLVYSTLLGGTDIDMGNGIAVDTAGNAYVTGDTRSSDFPATAGAYSTSFSDGFDDAFVAKLNMAGTSVVYATYLGGSFSDDGFGVAVDAAGSAYVTGFTASSDFPATPGAVDTSQNGRNDAFVTKLSADGSDLAYSTFLGGSSKDDGGRVAVDSAGGAYVTGGSSSTNFPSTAGAFDTTQNGKSDAFVAKLSPAGSGLAYSTFLGGTADDRGSGVAVQAGGDVYVTGSTASSGFPATGDADDISLGGTQDAFVTRVHAGGADLAYSTYLGGSGSDSGNAIALSSGGTAYVTGSTTSADFPTTAGASDTSFGGAGDAFVAKLNTGGLGAPATVTLSPVAGSNTVGASHSLTATVTDASAQPLPSVVVPFSVTGSTTTSGRCTTDSIGQCSYAYSGPQLPGTDSITAFADANGNATRDPGEPGATATERWVLPDSTDGRATGGGRLVTSDGHRLTFAFAALSSADRRRGTCMVVDHTARRWIRCIDVTAFVLNGNEVTIYGDALDNGEATTYVLHGVDNGAHGGRADSFSVATASGYAAAGTLLGGDVRSLPAAGEGGQARTSR